MWVRFFIFIFYYYLLFTYLLLVFFDLSIYKLLSMNEKKLKDVCKKQNNNAALGIRLPLLSLPSPPFLFLFFIYLFIYCDNILMNHKLRNI